MMFNIFVRTENQHNKIVNAWTFSLISCVKMKYIYVYVYFNILLDMRAENAHDPD